MYLSLVCQSTEQTHESLSEYGSAMLWIYKREDYKRKALTGTVTCHSVNEIWTQAVIPLDGPVLFPNHAWMMTLPCKEGITADTKAREGYGNDISASHYTVSKQVSLGYLRLTVLEKVNQWKLGLGFANDWAEAEQNKTRADRVKEI